MGSSYISLPWLCGQVRASSPSHIISYHPLSAMFLSKISSQRTNLSSLICSYKSLKTAEIIYFEITCIFPSLHPPLSPSLTLFLAVFLSLFLTLCFLLSFFSLSLSDLYPRPVFVIASASPSPAINNFIIHLLRPCLVSCHGQSPFSLFSTRSLASALLS